MERPTILLIEDNPIHAKMFTKTLECENYQVIHAKDGHTALQEMQHCQPQLILQDLVLPDVDSTDLIHKLRAFPNCADIPILAITAFLSQLEYHVLSLGFTSVLLKPIEPSRLVEVIKSYLPTNIPEKHHFGSGKHILLADDNPIQLKVVQRQLSSLGFTVSIASDGNDALLQASTKKIDLLISDVLMPFVDGFELCYKIRQDPKLAHLPIILLTAYYLEESDKELAKMIGANAYLTRSKDLKPLLDEIETCLSKKFSPSESILLPKSIKEDHKERMIKQLELQTINNVGLSKRCSLQSALLNFNQAVTDALCNRMDIITAIQMSLPNCLDSAGIFKCALYLKKENSLLFLAFSIGFDKNHEALEYFFYYQKVLAQVIQSRKLLKLPSAAIPSEISNAILEKANATSGLLVPIVTPLACLGAIFFASNVDLTDTESLYFAESLSSHISKNFSLTKIL